ncbi:15-cis-phytoene desaturase [Planctomycetes bacterium Pan216]|uniref:15-cis-phytoene desaturase n=2 Tax=Kolteria novifilia TaxID=2527975 RepID=A0A518B9R3_9BACT|nr:15-cis-phytoene desaturase [Planctomycetes bacterium Pan216]
MLAESTSREDSLAPRVTIVGGGLAGLAAASVLATREVKVTILEARPYLGGRASSFRDPTNDALLDNCQHVSMGCCTNLADFCERVGIADLLKDEETLYFQDERGRLSTMRSAPLPAPFHLLPSFLRLRHLSLGEKARIARGLHALFRTPTVGSDVSFRDWLMANGQTARTCDRYWGVILVSALNESLDRIDFRYARQVFVEGFAMNPRASVVKVPSVTLHEFYGERLERWLADHGVTVRLNSAVKLLSSNEGTIGDCRLRSGEVVTADHYILAIPGQRVLSLLPVEFAEHEDALARIGQMEYSPITSVHCWFDRPVMDLPHLVVIGRKIQWLFKRTAETSATAATDEGCYLQAVVSASRELVSLGKDAIQAAILEEIVEMFPEARDARLEHCRVVTERTATFSVTPGIDRLRPTQRTAIGNLWLAGDYTDTDWPATMEGAVRSGYLAANALLKSLGRAPQSLAEPLPASWFARKLIKSAALGNGSSS